jgi:GDP-D-mannose 3', 5'-epimerase
MKTALVCGAGGFIGSHIVRRLKYEGFWVRSVDLKFPEFCEITADDFVIGDLHDQAFCRDIVDRRFDEVYQLVADMGGAGYIFTGEHDADVMHNSGSINLNMVETCRKRNVKRAFYSSSACMYPAYNQEDPTNPNCAENSAYPSAPDSKYGWEKLFSERLLLAYNRNHGMECRVARYHNIFGPEGTWAGGKEKASAAICRKVAEAKDGGAIEIWDDGNQTRSFLYIDECVEGTLRLTRSERTCPFNIGPEEMVTINQLANMAMEIAGKKLILNHIPDPLGVRGRNSDNRLIKSELGWAPSQPLRAGLEKPYAWIEAQVIRQKGKNKLAAYAARAALVTNSLFHGSCHRSRTAIRRKPTARNHGQYALNVGRSNRIQSGMHRPYGEWDRLYASS